MATLPQPTVLFNTLGNNIEFRFPLTDPLDRSGYNFFFRAENVLKEHQHMFEFKAFPVFSCSDIYRGIFSIKQLFNDANMDTSTKSDAEKLAKLTKFRQDLKQKFIELKMPIAFRIINEFILTGALSIRGQKNVLYIKSTDDSGSHMLKLSVEDTRFNRIDGKPKDEIVVNTLLNDADIQASKVEVAELKKSGAQKGEPVYNRLEAAHAPVPAPVIDNTLDNLRRTIREYNYVDTDDSITINRIMMVDNLPYAIRKVSARGYTDSAWLKEKVIELTESYVFEFKYFENDTLRIAKRLFGIKNGKFYTGKTVQYDTILDMIHASIK